MTCPTTSTFACVGRCRSPLNYGKGAANGEKLLNVIGAGSCFGEWGVVNNARRGATLLTATNCEVLVIAGYHVKATCDINLLEELAAQGHQAKIVQDKAEADGTELAIGVAGSFIYDKADGQAHSKMGTVHRMKKSKPLSTLETGDAMIQSTPEMAPGRRSSLTLMQRRQEKRSDSILGSVAQPQAPSNKQDERSKISPRAARLNRSRTMGVLVESADEEQIG